MTPAEPPAAGASGPSDGSAAAPEERATRLRRSVVLLVVATVALLDRPHRSRRATGSRAPLVVIVATVAGGGFAFFEQPRPHLGLRPVVARGGAGAARRGRDLAPVLERRLVVHDVRPDGQRPRRRARTTTCPPTSPTDPFDHLVSPIWQHRGSVYGPAFVAYAAVVTYRGRRLAARSTGSCSSSARRSLVVAALAAGLATNPEPRRGRLARAEPGVRGDHREQRPDRRAHRVRDLRRRGAARAAARRGRAGLALGVASLVKITSLLALAGLVFWAWRREERRARDAAHRARPRASRSLVVYLPFLTGQSHVLAGADHWSRPAPRGTCRPSSSSARTPAATCRRACSPNYDAVRSSSTCRSVSSALLAVVQGWRWASPDRPELATGAATASYAIAAEYTLPWYAGWALPVLAATAPVALAWVIWWQAACCSPRGSSRPTTPAASPTRSCAARSRTRCRSCCSSRTWRSDRTTTSISGPDPSSPPRRARRAGAARVAPEGQRGLPGDDSPASRPGGSVRAAWPAGRREPPPGPTPLWNQASSLGRPLRWVP